MCIHGLGGLGEITNGLIAAAMDAFIVLTSNLTPKFKLYLGHLNIYTRN